VTKKIEFRVENLCRFQDHTKPWMSLPALKKVGMRIEERAADNKSLDFMPGSPKKVLHTIVRLTSPCYRDLNFFCFIEQFLEAEAQNLRIRQELNTHLSPSVIAIFVLEV
jgi:hypothetical protein